MFSWSSHLGSVVTNPTSIHVYAGSIPGLAQWVKDLMVAVSCDVSCRHGSDPVLLWLWYKPTAADPIQPLAWEPPYATGSAHPPQKKSFPNVKSPHSSTVRFGRSLGAQWVRDLALSLQLPGLLLWHGCFLY